MTVNIGEMVTTTLRKRSGKLADNITNHNALLKQLDQKGKKRTVSGGREIVEELEYAENSTTGWYSNYGTLDTSPQEVFDAATFDWKQLAGTVTISGLEGDVKNAGKEAIIRLLEKRITNLEKSLKNTMATALYSDGTTANEIGGLQSLVADDPTASATVGGIAQDTYSWWRNQTRTVSGGASASNIQANMNLLWIACIRGTDKPHMILADSLYYTFYENALQQFQRFTSPKDGTSGFETLAYKTASVYYDDQCPANKMYFLNCDYLYLRPHSRREFVPLKERDSINQDATVIPVVWAGNITTSNRSLQGVLRQA